MEFKKNAWKPILMCVLLSVGGSYLLMSLFYSLLGKGGPLAKVLLAPSATYSFVMAEPNLKKIMPVLPFFLLAFLLKAFKNEILVKKYKDASEFGLHGTSTWEKPSNVVNDKIFSKNNRYYGNLKKTFKMARGIIVGKIPGKKELLIIPHDTEIDNRNVLVIGSSGSGKGQSFVIPNLLNNTNETIICTDPKGELYDLTHQIKRDQGYKIYRVDFVGFKNCDRYNPLDYVKTDEDARSVANSIASNATDEAKRDFWSDSAIQYLSAFILYIKEEYKDKANMLDVINLLIKVGKDEEYLNDMLDNMGEEHPAFRLFALASMSKGNTRSGIFSTMAQQIGIFALNNISKMTNTSDFNFNDLQREKSVLYIQLRMDKNPFVQVTAMFFEQLIATLYDIAKNNKSLLPIRTIFLLDEFANIGTIKSYPSILSTCRGLGISMMTILQDFGQIEDKGRYGPEMARSIINNHDTTLFLRTKDTKTAEYFSKVAGETTVTHNSQSHSESTSLGKGGSRSTSEQYVKRALITPGELMKGDKNTCYLFVAGLSPMKLEKAWQFKIYGQLLQKYNKYREKLGFNTFVYQEDQHRWENNDVSPVEDIEEVIKEEIFEAIEPNQEVVEPVIAEIEQIAASIEESSDEENQEEEAFSDDYWIEEELRESMEEIENDMKQIEEQKVNHTEGIDEDALMGFIAEMIEDNKVTVKN